MDQDKTKLRKLDIAFGVFLIIISITAFIMAFFMPRGVLGSTHESLSTSPGIMPMAISAILILLGITLIWQAWSEGARITREDISAALNLWRNDLVQRTALIILILVVYGFGLLRNLPYAAATFVYLSVFMYLFKAGRIWKILLISGAASGLIWLFFGQIAMIPLP